MPRQRAGAKTERAARKHGPLPTGFGLRTTLSGPPPPEYIERVTQYLGTFEELSLREFLLRAFVYRARNAQRLDLGDPLDLYVANGLERILAGEDGAKAFGIKRRRGQSPVQPGTDPRIYARLKQLEAEGKLRGDPAMLPARARLTTQSRDEDLAELTTWLRENPPRELLRVLADDAESLAFIANDPDLDDLLRRDKSLSEQDATTVAAKLTANRYGIPVSERTARRRRKRRPGAPSAG